MPIPTKPPGGGGQTPRVHFTYLATPRGDRWHAWIAGPCHWFDAHTKGKSKPCLTVMCGGALECPRCTPLDPVEEIGYQPLYREVDGRPCMVIIHEHSRERVDQLKLHARVCVGREEEASAAVWVAPALVATPKYQTTLAERMRPADLTETLLRVWSIPALTEWYRKNNPVAVPVRDSKGVAMRDDGKPFSGHMQAAAKRYAPDTVVPETTELFDAARAELVERVKKSGNNGNGKPH